MKVRYIGGESPPGSGKTVAFGRDWVCQQVVELDAEFAAKFGAKISRNPAFEVLGDAPSPAPQARAEVKTSPPQPSTPATVPAASNVADISAAVKAVGRRKKAST